MDIDRIAEIGRLFRRRENIMAHNDRCILETVAFYEHILLHSIIKPVLFSENYDKYVRASSCVSDNLSFADRLKVASRIAKELGVERFKKFDDFVRVRNEAAHSLSSVGELDEQNKVNKIIFGGKEITWEDYLLKMKKWAGLSQEMANFVRDLYISINGSTNYAIFMYCKLMYGYVLVQYNLLLPEPSGGYTSFSRNGLDSEMIQYIKEECEYKSGV